MQGFAVATSFRVETKQPPGCRISMKKALHPTALTCPSPVSAQSGQPATRRTRKCAAQQRRGHQTVCPARLGQMVAFPAEPKFLTQNGYMWLCEALEDHPSQALATWDAWWWYKPRAGWLWTRGCPSMWSDSTREQRYWVRGFYTDTWNTEGLVFIGYHVMVGHTCMICHI